MSSTAKGLFTAMGLVWFGLGIVALQDESFLAGFIMLISGAITTGLALTGD